jgi:cysteine desulfuration protein SufE
MATTTLQDLIEGFSLFADWEDRYRYLIDLGRRVPVMDNALKTDENLVRGCTSRVWLVAGWDGDKLTFQADSDAQIVRGLIHILDLAYQGKTPVEIATLDIDKPRPPPEPQPQKRLLRDGRADQGAAGSGGVIAYWRSMSSARASIDRFRTA